MNWHELGMESAVTSYTVALIMEGIGYCLRKLGRPEKLHLIAQGSLALGFGLTTLVLLERGALAQRVPGINFYESLILLSGCVVLMYWIFCHRLGSSLLRAGTTVVAMIALAYALWLDNRIIPLLPIFQSGWLNLHVPLCFLSYGAFTLSAMTSLVYLLRHGSGSSELIVLQSLDKAAHQLIRVGFLLLTGGLVTGVIWANQAWGNFWRYDPKENGSLTTWIVYLIYLEVRRLKQWSGVRTAWISMVGFLCVAVNFWVVSFWLTGLHRYLGE